ncbi:secretion system protein E, partial [Enterococcus faecalis]
PNDSEIAISFRTVMQRTLYTQVCAEIGEKLIFHFKFIGGMEVGERRKAQLGATTNLIGETKQRLRLSSVGDFQKRESLEIRFLHRFGEQAEHFF